MLKEVKNFAKEEMECDAFSAMSNMSNNPKEFYDTL